MSFFDPLFVIPALFSLGILCCLGAGLIDIEAENSNWKIKIRGKGLKRMPKNSSSQVSNADFSADSSTAE